LAVIKLSYPSQISGVARPVIYRVFSDKVLFKSKPIFTKNNYLPTDIKFPN